MIEKLKKLCRLICISVLIGILLFPGQVMADTGENSCRVTLPVSVIYRNQNSADRRVFEYVLSAKESGVPMPQETELRITVSNGMGRGSFGMSEYTEPGEYHYEISQKSGSVKNTRYDKSTYEVTVYVLNDGQGGLVSEVWASKNGSGSKTDAIQFVNTGLTVIRHAATPVTTRMPAVRPTTALKRATTVQGRPGGSTTAVSHSVKTASSPKTGDNTPLEVFVGILVLSGVMAAAILVLRKRQKKQ